MLLKILRERYFLHVTVLFFANLKLLFQVISLQKLLSKDLSVTEKQMKTLQVKILGK